VNEIELKIDGLRKKRNNALFKFSLELQNDKFDMNLYNEILSNHIAMNVFNSMVGKTKQDDRGMFEKIFGKQKPDDVHF